MTSPARWQGSAPENLTSRCEGQWRGAPRHTGDASRQPRKRHLGPRGRGGARGAALGAPLDARTGHITFGASTLDSADAFPYCTFAAQVSSLAPVVDPTQGTVEVRLAIPNPPKFLRTDMTMTVNVEVVRRR